MFKPKAIIGSSFYEFVYPEDLLAFVESIKELLAKGHCCSPYYRLLSAKNEIVWWVQTEATTIMRTTRGHRERCVVCVHQMIAFVVFF